MIEMAELSDKDFKAIIIKIFQQAIVNMLETNEKLESSSKEKFKQRNRKYSNIYMEFMQLKNIITQ